MLAGSRFSEGVQPAEQDAAAANSEFHCTRRLRLPQRHRVHRGGNSKSTFLQAPQVHHLSGELCSSCSRAVVLTSREQLIIIPLGIALLFILLFPVVKAIAQLLVNKSTLDIQSAIITNPQNGS